MNAIPCMLLTLVYGCKVWNQLKHYELRVQATQMRVLRRIEGVSRVDRVRKEDIRLRLGQEGISSKEEWDKWKNRLEEMNDG